MATYEKALKEFKDEMDQLGMFHHEEVYHAITKYLGPSIHDRDASLVACSDPEELKRIKESFLIGKLGLSDGPHLDDAIKQACGALGLSNTKKHRPTFYYLLTAILDKGDVFKL
jgi:hypothetical protein